MKPPAFEYVAASSIEQAVAALGAGEGDAKIIAGGQSLMPMLNFRLLEPTVLVDINRLPGLDYIEADGDGLRIGALTRHHALETSAAVRSRFPVLAEAMRHVAHLAIRNRGTIGGSLSHADPAAELPMIAVLLDGMIVVNGQSGGREIAASQFFLGALSTALDDVELVTEIRLPAVPRDCGWAFEEIAQRSGDYAIAAAAAIVSVADGVAREVRLALTGVGETPLRASQAETALVGSAFTEDAVETAVNTIGASIEPMSDLHASADYRRHLAGVLSKRVLRTAWQRARDNTR